MSVMVLDNKRILLKGINRYELNSDEMYYRNDTEEERFFFILLNQDELWSEYSFKYLYIEMRDGSLYNFYSDKKLDNIMKDMAEYFKERGIDSEVEDCSYDQLSNRYDISEDLEEILKGNEDLEQAVESYVRIRDAFTFILVNQDISVIANRLDNAFGII